MSHLTWVQAGSRSPQPLCGPPQHGSVCKASQTGPSAHTLVQPPGRSTHSPGALVVKEEDKEELLSSLGLFLLSQLQHIQWGDRDGDTIVQEALPGHLGIDDLEAGKEKALSCGWRG